jgi:hypothetical protein
MRPVLWFSVLQEQRQAPTDPNRSYGIPRATFATAINLEPLPMHWATELSHPRENEVILGPRCPLPTVSNCLEAQRPRKDSPLASSQTQSL